MPKNPNKMPLGLFLLVKLLSHIKTPVIPENPKTGKWYRVFPEGYVASNGTPYCFNLRIGTENKLMIFFHGGGVSWNEYMAARPMSLTAEDMNDCYYSPEAGSYGAISGGHGICSEKKDNPFHNWSIISLPYCTGDFHCGTNDFPYTALDGSRKILHHHGYINTVAAIKTAMKWVGMSPEKLLITGNSAGGFGTALMSDAIMELFPNCQDVTSFVDSGVVIYDGWRAAAEEVWKTPEAICRRIHSNNITLDCLQALKADHGDRVKVLLTCSVRDINLTQLEGFVERGRLWADREMALRFQRELKTMCRQMIDTIPDVGLYIFDTPVSGPGSEENRAAGFTRHCIAIDDVANTTRTEGKTVQEWLWEAMNGKPVCIGLKLLEQQIK